MRKWIPGLVLLFLFLIPLPVFGQGELTFNSLRVDVRPEYDRTEVLVMYDIELPQSSLGSQLSLRIPAAAGNPFALASGAGDGTLFNLDYDRQVSGDWAFITFSPPMAFLRMEYYDPSLQRDGDTHSFTYTWPGDYAADSVTIMVMQPYGASEMSITPGQWKSQLDNDGLTFYGSEIGQLPSGEEVQIKVSYQKSSTDLTTEHLLPQPSGAIPQGTAGDAQWQQFIPWVFGILGALMLGGGLFWYWRTGQHSQQPVRQRRRAQPNATSPVEPSPATKDSTEIYCHQCGKRASTSDRFCRSCGARLRTE